MGRVSRGKAQHGQSYGQPGKFGEAKAERPSVALHAARARLPEAERRMARAVQGKASLSPAKVSHRPVRHTQAWAMPSNVVRRQARKRGDVKHC